MLADLLSRLSLAASVVAVGVAAGGILTVAPPVAGVRSEPVRGVHEHRAGDARSGQLRQRRGRALGCREPGRTRCNIIGVWQQDRWSDGGARGLATGYSKNGGCHLEHDLREVHVLLGRDGRERG